MHDYEIVRHKQTEFATYGRLYSVDKTLICVTLERPWVDADENGHRDHSVSRFVAGEYQLVKAESPKRGFPVWWFLGVPDIQDAQIHIANLPEDLEGCVGVGSAFGWIQSRKDGKIYPGITGSKYAFDKWMKDTESRDELVMLVTDRFE